MALTLKGQAGMALDSASRAPALLKIRDMVLRKEALADDSLSWTARTEDLLGGETILPDLEQTVSLYQDAVRVFHGHVSDPRDMPYGARVTVLGPWWWLRRTQLTSTVSGSERPTIDLPEATVAANLTTILNRAIAKGLPIKIGTIDAAVTIPPQQLSEMSFADAVADQCKWITDGVAWWDYSGTGYPSFNLTRRDDMDETTLAKGNAAGEVTDFEVAPMSELVASRVELTYMTGSGSDAVAAVQAAGTAAAGKTQVVAISGPERTEVLPTDFTDRLPVFISTTTPATALKFGIRGLQKLLQDYSGTLSVGVNSITDPYTVAGNKAKILSGRTEYDTWNNGTGNFSSGATAIPGGKTVVMFGLDGNATPPDWLVANYGLQKWTIKDCYIADGNSGSSTPVFDFNRRQAIFDALRPTLIFYSSTNPPSGAGAFTYAFLVRQAYQGAELDLPVWLMDSGSVPATVHSGTARSGTTASAIQLATTASAVDGTYVGSPIFWTKDGIRYGAYVTAYVGSTRTATLSTSQQTEHAPANGQTYEINGYFSTTEGSYSYIVPPAGLASALLAMQSWTPYAGRIDRKGASCDGLAGLDRKFNLSGVRSGLQTMGALAKSITYDFRAKTTTIELGPPSRHDFGTLAQRFRQSPQSNLA
ncbi:hypothetical protein [Luteolibacter marinus]|uniref:hypothetical protein n=1 Tax=Luteolibacter marinus TaxID=2776705 RepID=UPI0018663898|nr:hypothetical protein [Luteolibacter marinus]